MSLIINNPLDLSVEGIREFAEVLRTKSYEIITSIPTQENTPEIHPFYQDRNSYQLIMEDQNARFDYFSIAYRTAENEEVIIPIGVYGISGLHSVRFPLIIENFWQQLLKASKDEFKMVSQIKDDQAADFYYAACVQVRNDFIRSIFKYYYSLNPEYTSVMAWEMRGKNSNTKMISLSEGFEIREGSGCEIHSSVKNQNSRWTYLSNCYIRWGVFFPKNLANGGGITDKDPAKVQLFIRSMVNYQVEVC